MKMRTLPRMMKPRRNLSAAAEVRFPASALGLLIVLFVASLCQAQSAQRDAAKAAAPGPDLSIGAKQFPDEDAVILRWEQSWTLDKDGVAHRREHQWVKFLTHRAIGRFADPRIDFCDGSEQLTIHTAQTILSGGKVLPVAKYSFNLAAPDDVGGWPEYAAWQQQVICFGGIEDDCVTELDYEITTKAGTLPWLEADIRLHDDHPVVERIISVAVPDGTELKLQVDGIPAAQPVKSSADGLTTYRWTFKDLPAMPGEAQTPRWEKRCGRLRFTTCKSGDDWATALLKKAAAAIKPDDTIKKFAEAAIEQERDEFERARKIANKMRDSFTVVDSPKAIRSLVCRDAADVLRANYGNPLEAAALLAAALESLDIHAAIEIAVDATAWSENTATTSAFAGAVVAADLPGGPVLVHPSLGVLRKPATWGRRHLLSMDSNGTIKKSYAAARGETDPSKIEITGKITIDKDGKAVGDLLINLTGLFYDPASLETAASQESLVKGLVGRVFTGASLKSHAITVLSDEALRAKATAAPADPLKSQDKKYILKLGDGPAFLPDAPLPLGRSARRTDIQLAGRLTEDVDVTIEMPDGWTAAAVPASLPEAKGAWGSVKQEVTVDGKYVRFHRAVTLSTEIIPAKDFAALRDAVNQLRSEASRTLVVTPGEPKKDKDATTKPAAE